MGIHRDPVFGPMAMFGLGTVLLIAAVAAIPLLIDLPAKTAALRRRIAEDRKEARTLAAHSARLRDQPVDLELLAIDRVLGAADLIGARRVAVAAVKRSKLGLALNGAGPSRRADSTTRRQR